MIRAEALGKRYTIGHRRDVRSDTLVDTIARAAGDLWRKMRHPLDVGAANLDLEELWALRDVDFEINEGERVGIVGRNGAGKTTLLKVLSRITRPTAGRAVLRGRVGSLLEIGTGFNPELNGRENIYLNGAILGMRKAEIDRKFDEIVAFAEVEKFLDTPVKRYSNGMRVRLAFAVAAHLEPEILLVDEVLAVGDVEFQRKCLGKMREVGEGGRTVLFVSHNMEAITRLCETSLWIDRGRLVERGPSREVVMNYLTACRKETASGVITPEMHNHEPRGVEFTDVEITDDAGAAVTALGFGEAVRVCGRFRVTRALKAPRVGVTIHALDDRLICAFQQPGGPDDDPRELAPGTYRFSVRSSPNLMPGFYVIGLFAKPAHGYYDSPDDTMDHVPNAITVEVRNRPLDDSPIPPSGGLVLPESDWSVEPE